MGPRSGERGNVQAATVWKRCRLASMGPRSGERGNTSRIHHRTRASRGFNGAALRRARKLPDSYEVTVSPDWASMGPRSGERGNDPETRSQTAAAIASMGPRSGERGNSPRFRAHVINGLRVPNRAVQSER